MSECLHWHTRPPLTLILLSAHGNRQTVPFHASVLHIKYPPLHMPYISGKSIVPIRPCSCSPRCLFTVAPRHAPSVLIYLVHIVAPRMLNQIHATMLVSLHGGGGGSGYRIEVRLRSMTSTPSSHTDHETRSVHPRSVLPARAPVLRFHRGRGNQKADMPT